MLKQCIICENWFDTKDRGSRAITCSDGCSKKRKRERYRERRQERYQNDPDFRERTLKNSREWYKKPGNRERRLKYNREWRSKVKKHGFMKAIEMVKKISKKLSEEKKGES